MLPDLEGIYGTTCSTAEWQKRLDWIDCPCLARPFVKGLSVRRRGRGGQTAVNAVTYCCLQPAIIIHNGH